MCNKYKKKCPIARASRSSETQKASIGNAASTRERHGNGLSSFGSFEQPYDVDSLDLLVDSGSNGFTLQESAHFKELDELFIDEVSNANGGRTTFGGRGTGPFWVLNSKSKQGDVELNQAL